MTNRSTEHTTFVIERNYDAAPARVFAAWSDPAIKKQWFVESQTFDFRVGGREFNRGEAPDGAVYTYDLTYQEIVPDERIVGTYIMDRDETRISASVLTVEFVPSGQGTKLVLTEQGVFLDGHDKSEFREHGTNFMIDKLGGLLAASGQEFAKMETEQID